MKAELPIKTVFLGSNWESVRTLKTLDEDKRFKITGVITQPDKPVGRKKILKSTPVKSYAIENSIPVLHTKNSKKRYREALERFAPELVVVKAFGELIPKFFITTPIYEAINVHFSLLPKYRGAVPVQMAILNGDKESGITFVKMVKKLDAGPILQKFKERVKSNDTNLSLRKRLVEKAAAVLPDVLLKWCNGDITPTEQNKALATYCYQEDIAKNKAYVEFDIHTADEIDRMIRAFIPWPVAWTMLNNKRLKIFKAEVINKEDLNSQKPLGELFEHNGKFIVKCKEGNYINIIDLQIEGRTRMKAKEFLHGYEL